MRHTIVNLDRICKQTRKIFFFDDLDSWLVPKKIFLIWWLEIRENAVGESTRYHGKYPTPSRQNTQRICTRLKDDLSRKWSGHVHPNSPVATTLCLKWLTGRSTFSRLQFSILYAPFLLFDVEILNDYNQNSWNNIVSFFIKLLKCLLELAQIGRASCRERVCMLV